MSVQPDNGGVDQTANEAVPDEGYRRALSSRQVQMMALGSAIGVGLFYGSGAAIAAAGPAIIATFMVAGLIAFLVMRALGELVVYRPTSGSVMDYAKEFLGPFAGFATGWSYWMSAVTICSAEVIAAGHYLTYWFPGVPVWLTAAVAFAILLLANLFSVKFFGELEFWFAGIKVIAILALIVIGVGVLILGFSSLGDTASVKNLWQHDGFAPNGVGQAVFMMQAAFFAYSGIELAAGTAGEAVDPRRTLRSAINLLPLRISVFYVGSLVVILTLMPWTSYRDDSSPFVQAFAGIGLPAAAGVMNFVVLTAALSACNVNIYMASRLVRRMSVQGDASAAFGRLSGRQVPTRALAVIAIGIALGIGINLASPEKAFGLLVAIATCTVLWAWTVILVCHLRYRGAVRAGRLPGHDFRLPGAPLTNWITLALIALVTALLAHDPDTRIALYVGAGWAVLLLISYALLNRADKRVSPAGTPPGLSEPS
jgi:AAT family amino acid transporter